ncbi:MAG: hypothetical protein AB1330_01650 [Bacillota bacterium]
MFIGDFEQRVVAYCAGFDDELAARMEYYLPKLKRVTVPAQITEGHVKSMNSLIDDLYTEVVFDYTAVKDALEDVKRKIEVVLKANYKGPNERARMGAAIEAAKNFRIGVKEDGNPEYVNLFEIETRLRRRFLFLDAILKILQQKSDRLLSDLAVLKIESNLRS